MDMVKGPSFPEAGRKKSLQLTFTIKGESAKAGPRKPPGLSGVLAF